MTKRPNDHPSIKSGTKKGRPEEENFSQETGLLKIFKSNYHNGDDERTRRTSHSRINVSRSEDMGGHVLACRLCNSDKYEIRAANGR
jgi:hypothetical protein